MAQITDLTWQQLETASGTSGSSSLIIPDSSLGLLLRLSALGVVGLGSGNARNLPGVVQALYQRREFAAIAQANVNAGQSIGERLAAFPPASNGTAINGFVMSSGQIITRTPLATTGIIGASN
jgi:hypothetical protein